MSDATDLSSISSRFQQFPVMLLINILRSNMYCTSKAEIYCSSKIRNREERETELVLVSFHTIPLLPLLLHLMNVLSTRAFLLLLFLLARLVTGNFREKKSELHLLQGANVSI